MIVAFITRRLLFGVITLFIISALVFFGTEILPGDVAQAILGQNATPELVAQMRDRLGLDAPIMTRFFNWMLKLSTGDLGTSLASGTDIGAELSLRLMNTVILSGVTVLISVPTAIALGVWAVNRPGGVVDRTVSGISLTLISFPDFLIAVLLVSVFAVGLGWLPAIASIKPSYTFIDWVRVLILPVTALTLSVLAHMVRMTRAAILSVLSSPSIEMAVLKGIPRRRILFRHALPNAAGPIVNVVALNIVYLVSGVVVIESLFNFPGVGRYMVEGVTNRDVPVVQVCAIIFCSAYVLTNLLADAIAVLLNPRARYPK
jgi:peptide/nickel transport system permease protein